MKEKTRRSLCATQNKIEEFIEEHKKAKVDYFENGSRAK